MRLFTIVLAIIVVASCTTIPLTSGTETFVGNVWPNGIGDEIPGEDLWNQLTPENAGKWVSVERSRDVMDWQGLDGAYGYAKEHNTVYKHHTLVWGQQQPKWIETLSGDEQLEEIVEWFELLSVRYPEMDLIDVVNEPTHERPPYADALGGEGTTGWDWVVTSFQLARKYFPQSDLLINDYNILKSASSTREYLAIVDILIEKNLLDGIGVQAHFLEKTSPATVQKRLDQIASRGLPIYVSEFEINDQNDVRQAEQFKELFTIFYNHPSVAGITLWGHVQNRLWKKDAYLVRKDGSNRPAMEWLINFLGRGPRR